MGVLDEVRRGWAEHGDDPERIASLLPDWVAAAEPADAPELAGLVVHVLGEHLARFAEARALLHQLEERCGAPDPVKRSVAILCLVSGDVADAEARIDATEDRVGSEPRVLAVAAGIAGLHGRTTDAARWLMRAATLSYALPDDHLAVRAVAVNANNLACALEQRRSTDPEDQGLLRSAASLARVAWDRSGTWKEVERAEYRLAMTSLALGEPFAAVAHAQACEAICTANGADATERLFAAEALTRARHAIGDVAGAAAARDEVAALAAAADPAVDPARVLSGVDQLLAG